MIPHKGYPDSFKKTWQAQHYLIHIYYLMRLLNLVTYIPYARLQILANIHNPHPKQYKIDPRNPFSSSPGP